MGLQAEAEITNPTNHLTDLLTNLFVKENKGLTNLTNLFLILILS